MKSNNNTYHGIKPYKIKRLFFSKYWRSLYQKQQDLTLTQYEYKIATHCWLQRLNVSFRQGCVKPPESRFLLSEEAADGGSADLKLACDFGFADSLPV